MAPVPVIAYSAFKTPATSEVFFDFKEREQIPEFLRITKIVLNHWLPMLHIGGGTNCLFAFDHFPGLIVRHRLKWVEPRWNTLWSASGELVSPLATQCLLEFGSRALVPWVGLPGTVGGAVTGNAGCFGLSTSDILVSVEVLSLTTGEISQFTPTDLEFSYRESRLKWQTDIVVLSALWNAALIQADNQYTRLSIEEMQALRRTKQPPGPSCGSYFKNPTGTSAGKLIDEAGLKGLKIGGMQISEHHANFFINIGGATYQDVLALAEEAKSRVFARTGLALEEEVRIICAPDLR